MRLLENYLFVVSIYKYTSVYLHSTFAKYFPLFSTSVNVHTFDVKNTNYY